MRRIFSRSAFFPWSGLRRFVGARDGGVMVIFGILAVPLLLGAGVAIDYTRAANTRSNLQASVDAAALAAATALANGGNPAQTAANYVQQRFPYMSRSVTTTTTVDAATGTVTVDARTSEPTTVMKIAHIDAMPVSAQARAAIGAGGQKLEIGIAMDVTASMAPNGKLDSAKAAARDLITKVMLQPNGSPRSNVRVGIVPFAEYVNVGTQYAGADWLTSTADYSETLPERCYPTHPNIVYGPTYYVPYTCSRDGVPYDCTYSTADVISYGDPVTVCTTPTVTRKWWGCVASQNSPADESDLANAGNKVPVIHDRLCGAPLSRLGSTKERLFWNIDVMLPYGETYIAHGLLWGWRLLSHRPPFADGSATADTKKVLVLMTDGANTLSANYPLHTGTDVAASNDKLVKTCEGVKKAGIMLYTIAFQVTDATIQNLLSQCATGVPFYYNAKTNGELQAAFSSIGSQINNLRLIR